MNAIFARHAGRRELVRPRRVLAARRHQRPERGDRVRRLDGLVEADDAGAVAGRAGRQAPGGVRRRSRRRSSSCSCRRRSRGSGSPAGSRCRSRTARASGSDVLQERTQAIIDEARKRPEIGRRGQHVPGRRAAGLPEHRPRQGRADGRAARATCSPRCRPTSARCTSTTSTSSTGPTRCASRPTPQFRGDPRRSAGWRSATATAAMVPLGTLLDGRDADRPAVDHPLQPVPDGDDQRRGRPGRQLRRGAQGDGGDRRARRCRGRWATSGPAIAFQEKRVSGEAVVRLRAGRAAGLPGAGRAVRELAAAAGGDPGRAARAARRGGGGRTSAGMDNNIYTQIGVVLIIALASKNAILIVEFARELRLAGHGRSARRRSRRRGCGSGRS